MNTMGRKDVQRLLRGYMGTISIRNALALSNWEARRAREMAMMLVAQGFYPIEIRNGSIIYERKNQGHA